jgi:hypothetical protein
MFARIVDNSVGPLLGGCGRRMRRRPCRWSPSAHREMSVNETATRRALPAFEPVGKGPRWGADALVRARPPGRAPSPDYKLRAVVRTPCYTQLSPSVAREPQRHKSKLATSRQHGLPDAPTEVSGVYQEQWRSKTRSPRSSLTVLVLGRPYPPLTGVSCNGSPKSS